MKKSFAESWSDYRLLICLGLCYAIFCCWQAKMLGISTQGLIGWIWLATRHVIALVYIFVMSVMTCVFLRSLYRARWKWGVAGTEFGAWIREFLSSHAFVGGVVGLLACYTALFFIIQKGIVRWVHPYAWDQDFERWDKELHGGRHPFEYLLTWFGGRGFDSFLELCYIGWFFFMYIGHGYALFCDRDRWRKLRYVIVFCLSWMLMGGFGAIILSSVCPVFYHHFYPGMADVYKPLTDYLVAHQDDFKGIIFMQEMLLKWHYNPGVIIPNGIAAMPSMHAAISTLIVLYAWSLGRVIFASALICAVLIIISSIYFGFHYAIDSYFSIITICLMWWLTGFVVKWKRARA